MERHRNLLNWGSKLTAMRKAILLFGVFLVTMSSATFGQELSASNNSVVQKDNGEIKKKWDAAFGSFQFQILKERTGDRNFQIDMSIIYKIEEGRHETEVRYITYNDYIRVKILPESMIQGEYEHLEMISEVNEFINE